MVDDEGGERGPWGVSNAPVLVELRASVEEFFITKADFVVVLFSVLFGGDALTDDEEEDDEDDGEKKLNDREDHSLAQQD